MLIYNFQKEFLGIDEKDLKTLGFNTLSELRAEVTDFADLFVKTPGYVHNFKHVHWIDFINYADISEESKVLINVNAKTFKATLSVSPIYLIDNLTSPAYIIHLNHLRPLSKSENANLSSDILERELPKVEPQEKKIFTAAAEVAPIVADAYDESPQDYMKAEEEILNIDEPFPLEEESARPQTVHNNTSTIQETELFTSKELEMDNLSLDVFEEETPTAVTETTVTPTTVKQEIVQEAWDNGYKYDPHIASKELGLPLDLIEEFIQDFIAQAKEFKEDIYTSIEENDVDNVKILSHKLKGVAANLRIEDAHEVLSAVSATADMEVIHENLDTFYKIIAKLAGEPAQIPTVTEETPLELNIEDEDSDDDFLTLDFKDDEFEEPTLESAEELLSIEDKDVPDKIEMPELADDDFLKIEPNESIEELIPEEDKEEKQKLHFSKSDAAKEIGIDEMSFNELFEDFITESRTILQRIHEAIEKDDMQSIKNEAVKFKGMSDNMRFKEFSQELDTLIHTTDKDKILQSEQAIDATLKKISEMGA